MSQAIEQDKLAVEVTLEDRCKVEFYEARLGKADRVAQEPQPQPMRDDAPQRIGSVEIVLHQRMRAARRVTFAIELLFAGNDVHRRRSRIGAKPVRDSKGAAS